MADSRPVHKRTPGEIIEDRKTVARLFVRGLTQDEIAAELNKKKDEDKRLSRQMVSYDIKAITKEWQAAAVTDVGKVLAMQLRRLAWIEAEAEDAWERSKQDATEQQQMQTQDGPPVLDKQGKIQEDKVGMVVRLNSRSSVVMKRRGQVGKRDFLDTILDCVRERNRIFGLYAPEKLQIEDLDSAIEAELKRLKGANDKSLDPPANTTSSLIN